MTTASRSARSRLLRRGLLQRSPEYECTRGAILEPDGRQELPDGEPDPSFGSSGFVRVPLGEGNVLTAIDHAGDDKLILGFRTRPSARGGEHAAMARVWN